MIVEPSAAVAPPPIPPDPLAPPPRVSRIRWGLSLAIMAALPVVIGMAGMSRRVTGPALGHNAQQLLTVCGFDLGVFALIFGVAWLLSRATKDDLLLRWRPGYWVVPFGMGYSVLIRMAAGLVMVVGAVIVVVATRATQADVQKFTLANRPRVETLVDMQALNDNPLYFWLTVIFVSMVMGGLREELWRSSFLAGVRSLWPRTFGSTGGGIAGAAVASLFFGAGHIPQGMLAVLPVTVVGFLLGVIMSLHRSIWPSVIAHGLFDAASLALLPWVTRHLPELEKLAHPG